MTGPLTHHPNCLGCGEQNAGGLGLRMRAESNRVLGEVTLDRRHEGAPGFAHGGAVATALDDALGALMMVLEVPAVTAKLEVDYRRPALLGRRFELEVWLESREGRKLRLAGELREEGERVAAVRALFIEVDREHFIRGAGEPWPAAEGSGELPR